MCVCTYIHQYQFLRYSTTLKWKLPRLCPGLYSFIRRHVVASIGVLHRRRQNGPWVIFNLAQKKDQLPHLYKFIIFIDVSWCFHICHIFPLIFQYHLKCLQRSSLLGTGGSSTTCSLLLPVALDNNSLMVERFCSTWRPKIGVDGISIKGWKLPSGELT